MCGISFCKEHGDIDLMLCNDCIEYNSLTREEDNKALEIDFSAD